MLQVKNICETYYKKLRQTREHIKIENRNIKSVDGVVREINNTFKKIKNNKSLGPEDVL